MKIRHLGILLCLFSTLFQQDAQAIILLGGDNSANQFDPGGGIPWESVGEMAGGTGVYLGNGYVITAAHVNPFATINLGGMLYSYDGGATTTFGTADLRVFHLSSTPTVGAAVLYTGNLETSVPATLIGTGFGRDPNTSVGATVVPWGTAEPSTRAKRFGTNQPNSFTTIFSGSYGSETIITSLGSLAGPDEAALTSLDSGSGMFQNIGGSWFLTGIGAYVTTDGSSTFGNNLPPDNALATGDFNAFIRISRYATAVSAAIPEPGQTSLALLSFSLLLTRRKR